MKKLLEIKQGSCDRLGVIKEKDGINFAISAPDQEVYLILYKKGSGEVIQEIPFPEKAVIGNIYSMKISGLNVKELEYNFRIKNKIFQDPYAKVITGRDTFGIKDAVKDAHKVRCGFSFDSYDWSEEEKPGLSYEEVIAYQLHVRGFTKDRGSKVRHKGTFKGMMEKIPYLKDLGINMIKLMPSYEFDEIKDTQLHQNMSYMSTPLKEAGVNYWGYGGGNYFAPKKSYSSSPDPVREFKDMVKLYHKNGIEVIMEFYFPKEVSLRTMTDCLSFWISEYHVDGFHILADQVCCEFISKDPFLAATKLIGIYFPTEEMYQVPSENPCLLAECNDGFLIDIRKFLKGDEDQLNTFVYRMRRNPSGRGLINYITNHDGFTLNDLVSYDEKHNEQNGEQNRDGTSYNYSWNCGVEGITRRKKILDLRLRQMKNAFVLLLLAQGTPMIQAGDELANSQEGNNNSYCQDNEISWVNYNPGKRNQELYTFVKNLIAFRKRYKILHMPYELKVMDTVSCGYPDLSYHSARAWYGGFEHMNRQIGMMYCGFYGGEDIFIYAAYNMHWVDHEFALPHLPENMLWHLAVDTRAEGLVGVWEEGQEPVLEEQNMLIVQERTIRILIGRAPVKTGKKGVSGK